MFNWDAAQVSPGAEPARRWRLRKQLGRAVITFNVSPHLTDKLVRLGRLDATERQPGSARGKPAVVGRQNPAVAPGPLAAPRSEAV